MRTIVEEIKKAVANGAVKKTAFTGAVRDTELNYIKEGDILLFTADYTVLEQPVRGSENTTEMMYISAKRDGADINVPFYPSLFWKSRQVCDENNKPTSEFRRSNGEVVDFVQGYGTIDEAIKAIAAQHPNGVKVSKMDTFKTLRYGQPTDGTGRVQNANIPTLIWA